MCVEKKLTWLWTAMVTHIWVGVKYICGLSKNVQNVFLLELQVGQKINFAKLGLIALMRI